MLESTFQAKLRSNDFLTSNLPKVNCESFDSFAFIYVLINYHGKAIIREGIEDVYSKLTIPIVNRPETFVEA